jgi:sister-chromatid-cohesion protein PDS5
VVIEHRELLFFVRALTHQEAEGKSELGKKEDGDNLSLILAILRTIKGCENVVDQTKNEVCSDSYDDWEVSLTVSLNL